MDKEQKEFERLQRCGENDEEEEEEEEEEAGQKSCSSSTGCGMVFRPDPSGLWWEDPAAFWLYEDDPAEGILTDDPNYEYQGASDYEILEYDSQASGDEGISENAKDVDNLERTEAEEWLFKVPGPDSPEFDTEFLPLDSPLGAPLYFKLNNGGRQANVAALAKASRLEHIGGPGCRHDQAYIGKHISTEEMRGCHTVQGILWKKPGSKPQSDDLEFEHESHYFLTGIAERMPSSGTWLDCYPVRYGADDRVTTETNFVLETVSSPFYPVVLCYLHLRLLIHTNSSKTDPRGTEKHRASLPSNLL
jgi:hypothetical protein